MHLIISTTYSGVVKICSYISWLVLGRRQLTEAPQNVLEELVILRLGTLKA